MKTLQLYCPMRHYPVLLLGWNPQVIVVVLQDEGVVGEDVVVKAGT